MYGPWPCLTLLLAASPCDVVRHVAVFHLASLYLTERSILPFSALPCDRQPTCAALPHPILPYSTPPFPTLPYPTLPYSTLPYPTLPYPTLPCPTLFRRCLTFHVFFFGYDIPLDFSYYVGPYPNILCLALTYTILSVHGKKRKRICNSSQI